MFFFSIYWMIHSSRWMKSWSSWYWVSQFRQSCRNLGVSEAGLDRSHFMLISNHPPYNWLNNTNLQHTSVEKLESQHLWMWYYVSRNSVLDGVIARYDSNSISFLSHVVIIKLYLPRQNHKEVSSYLWDCRGNKDWGSWFYR